MGEVSDYLFHCLFLDNIFLCGWEHGWGHVGRSLGMGVIFSYDLFSKNIFYVMIQNH